MLLVIAQRETQTSHGSLHPQIKHIHGQLSRPLLSAKQCALPSSLSYRDNRPCTWCSSHSFDRSGPVPNTFSRSHLHSELVRHSQLQLRLPRELSVSSAEDVDKVAAVGRHLEVVGDAYVVGVVVSVPGDPDAVVVRLKEYIFYHTRLYMCVCVRVCVCTCVVC